MLMKTIFYLVCTGLMLNSAILVAQPTITSATAGSVGDVFSFENATVSGFDPGASGAGVTWDFSDLSLTGSSIGYNFITPEASGHAATFPGATVAAELDGGSYAYYKINASEYTLIGLYTAASTLVYSDPETYMTFPMTMGTTSDDDLHCEYTTGVETIRDGSISVEADAYGTLILPGGTYTNVLRVVLHEVYSDEFVGLPYTSDYDFTHYYFLREGTVGPLFQYSLLEIGGLFPSTTEQASVNNNIGAVGIDELAQNAINLFPNPANTQVAINLQNVQADQIFITDLSGRTLLQSNTNGTSLVTFDLQSLPAGMYFARIVAGSETYSKQFQIVN